METPLVDTHVDSASRRPRKSGGGSAAVPGKESRSASLRPKGSRATVERGGPGAFAPVMGLYAARWRIIPALQRAAYAHRASLNPGSVKGG